MPQKLSLSKVLFKSLSIPLVYARNIYVERALQERRAAATALQCIEAHTLCLDHCLSNFAGGDARANAALAEVRSLVKAIQKAATYDEVEMEHASAEL